MGYEMGSATNSTRHQLLWGATLVLCIALVNGSCFPAIFNFGDSQSDTGGIHAAFPSFTPAEFPPYGQTFFEQPQWRYSDGRLLIDFIAAAMGLPFIDPYLQSITSDFYHGANFATAGATVLPVTYLSPFNFNIQLLQFMEFQKNVLAIRNPKDGTLGRTSTTIKSAASSGICYVDPYDYQSCHAQGVYRDSHWLCSTAYSEKVHRLPLPEFFAQALYTICIGGNDITYGHNKGKTPAEVEEYLPQVADGIIAGIKRLYNAGGRNFLVWDEEPQGCLPYTLTLIPHKPEDLDEHGCLPRYNQISVFFNAYLNNSLTELRQELQDATIVLFSTYELKSELIFHHEKHGFKHVNRACCGVPNEFNFDLRVACGMKQVIENVTFASTTCTNPNEYIVWDGVHTTEAANRYIAKQMFTGKFFYPKFPKLIDFCNLGPLT